MAFDDSSNSTSRFLRYELELLLRKNFSSSLRRVLLVIKVSSIFIASPFQSHVLRDLAVNLYDRNARLSNKITQ
jgi:hypothetical protein